MKTSLQMKLLARFALMTLIGLTAVTLSTSCTHARTTAETAHSGTHQSAQSAQGTDRRYPAAAHRLAALPDQAAWQSLYDYADALDLTNPAIDLKMHNGEGTSVYGVMSINGKPIGAIIPENSSASVSGETLAFTLSRAFGVYQIYQPGVYHFLSGANLDAFMKIVPRQTIISAKTGKRQTNKDDNRIAILKRYHDQPQGMDAVFKRWDDKPKDFNEINGVGPYINKSLVLSGSRAPLASLVQCGGPQPNPNTRVTFMGGSNSEFEVARELSAILLIDALTGQWDRFSGGNMQVITKQTTSGPVSMLAAIDNGGTWQKNAVDANLSMVSRFDRGVADQILAMDDFFTLGQPYLGLRNEAEFKSAFDIVQISKTFARFKENVKKTANHIRANEGCYF
jgi:hypothetical protein